jgi:hypothetical protein
MLKVAFKGQPMGRTQVFGWFSKLKSGMFFAEDAERSSRPSTNKTAENMKLEKELILENRRISIRSTDNMLRTVARSLDSL